MNIFLRTIGFSNINNYKDLDDILNLVISCPDKKQVVSISAKEDYVEFSKYFAKGIGICVTGIYDENGLFRMDSYFPFADARQISICEEQNVIGKSIRLRYSVMCDDSRLGVLLIFLLKNTADYLKVTALGCTPESLDNIGHKNTYLSALSIEGKIILPVHQNEEYKEQAKLDRRNRTKLISDAKNGDPEAIDSLTIEEIDTYESISKRALNEDLYSIVETSFYPYGSESDHYSIIGTILDYELLENDMTGETVYLLLVETNDVILDVAINSCDLLGVPSIGTRFKGNIWLQGKVEF